MKRLTIFGSTGSIGRSVLSVVRRYPGAFRVVGLSASGQAGLLARQAAEFRPEVTVLSGGDHHGGPPAGHPAIPCLAGPAGLKQLAGWPGVDLAVLAIPGADSLAPAIWCLESGRPLALASKEALVMAGELLGARAAAAGSRIIPLDSEHNSLFQILEQFPGRPVQRVCLTASGGPFWRRPRRSTTPAAVLDHPVWRMGRKVTVDSATMINKALEVIEAHYLFGLPADRIAVLVHPEVAVHGLVEFCDGFTLACLSPPDMRFPIAAGLFWPGHPPRPPAAGKSLGLARGNHTFRRPTERRFPALRLARQVIERGGTFPAAFSVADEEAVAAFLDGRLPFEAIVPLVGRVVEAHREPPAAGLPGVLAAAAAARAAARAMIAAGGDFS